MVLDACILFVGLALLLGGGDTLVRGASALARSFDVSPLAVGLTVVAFGTSAPELAVNLTAAVLDTGELSFGNIIGSNMANIGLVIGVTALLRPLEIHGKVITREAPMMLLATAATVAMGLDQWLNGGSPHFSRGESIVLLLLFGVFLSYTVRDIQRQRASEALLREARDIAVARHESRGVSIALTLVGLLVLLGGADLTVAAASRLAREAGVSEALIGLTLVAVGTSLPELMASLMAAYREQPELAVGNIVGSNIFNLLLVLGVSGLARPIPVPPGGTMDLIVMSILSVGFWMASATHRNRINRYEAAALLSLYLIYMTMRTTLGIL